MQDDAKSITIGDRQFHIVGDAGYLKAVGAAFEPDTIGALRALAADQAQALDVGANIGLTACALSQFCEKVSGIEPVPRTFGYLQRNTSNLPNVKIFKHALGSSEGIVRMQGYPDFLAGSFIADAYEIPNDNHFLEEVAVKRLDDCFPSLGLDRIDLMKVDVEGFELEVFEGGRQVIGDFKPMAFLEMNHWCLNIFRRISLPEFRERLLAVFPVLYAMDGDEFVDFAEEGNLHRIYHGHLVEHRFANLVAGFDRDEIVGRLTTLCSAERMRRMTAPPPEPEIDYAALEIAALRDDLARAAARVEELEKSTSWRLTAPLRAAKKIIG